MPYKDPEKKKQYMKEYSKQYRENNKEKAKEYNQTPEGKKVKTISNWKQRGLIHDNYSDLYDKYLDTSECDVCKYVFDETNWRCMDHDHTTGLFRQFLCNRCNNHDMWKKLI